MARFQVKFSVRFADATAFFDEAIGSLPDPLKPVRPNKVSKHQIAIAKILFALGLGENFWHLGKNFFRFHEKFSSVNK
jgi:hypothetical protein